MTWQQITVDCPYCGEPTLTHRDFTRIRLLCSCCGGWFTFAYRDGRPVAALAASPEEASLSAEGGWKAYKGVK